MHLGQVTASLSFGVLAGRGFGEVDMPGSPVGGVDGHGDDFENLNVADLGDPSLEVVADDAVATESRCGSDEHICVEVEEAPLWSGELAEAFAFEVLGHEQPRTEAVGLRDPTRAGALRQDEQTVGGCMREDVGELLVGISDPNTPFRRDGLPGHERVDQFKMQLTQRRFARFDHANDLCGL